MSTENVIETENKASENQSPKMSDFVKTNAEGKRVFDLVKFKQYITTSLSYQNFYDRFNRSYLSYSRCEIENMAEHPELYGRRIVNLSQYMYLKSGYYKRLIDYFVNQAKLNYTIDTQALKPGMISNNKSDTIRKNYISFAAQSEKFGLQNEIHNILKRLYRDDACFAYVLENESGISYYYFDPLVCHISKLVNGKVYQFNIDIPLAGKLGYIELFPDEIQLMIEKAQNKGLTRLEIPIDKCLCIKYNNDVPYLNPPFFMMIADILLIDEYKDLAKAQSINDAYKILTLKIPTKDGEITLDDGLISTFVGSVFDTVQNNIGVITTPFDMATEEFSSSNADDRDTVSDAISWAFKNVGVSEALMSGASSGSELKLSVTNDSGDLFRIYRMIEDWVNLQLHIRGFVYPNYEFVYKILDMTIFNEKDFISNELQMAQNGLPNKSRLASANGMSPAVMIGNSVVENEILKDMFDSWMPLQTSYTMSGNGSLSNSSSETVGGRPVKDDADVAAVTEVQRENDSNDTENRI